MNGGQLDFSVSLPGSQNQILFEAGSIGTELAGTAPKIVQCLILLQTDSIVILDDSQDIYFAAGNLNGGSQMIFQQSRSINFGDVWIIDDGATITFS